MRRPRQRTVLLGAACIVVVGVAALIVSSSRSTGAANDAAADRGATAATVRRGSLASNVYENGTLGYEAQADGSPYTLVNQASGLYTKLPGVGEDVRCGAAAYAVDGEPVLLLCGNTPAYRSLSEGMSGPDVRVLNRNLVELGYASGEEIDPDSDYFADATTSALERLQGHLDLEETGTMELGEAIVLPGPLRITATAVALGAAANPGGPLAEATSRRRRVELDLPAGEAVEVEVGDPAMVTLPDNESTPGVVSRVGGVASSPAGSEAEAGPEADSSDATIPVYVRLRHPDDVASLEQAPVRVEITTSRVKDTLSVPVTALLARAGGGYAVEVIGGADQRRLVPVKIGMFDHASGRVGVTGSGLRAGQRVAVPAA